MGETLVLAPDLPRSAPVVGAAEAVAELVREVAESEVKGMGTAALLRTLTALDESARLVDLARSKVLAEVDRTEAWRGQGRDTSLAGWRSRTTRTGQGTAHRELATARTLAQVPGASDALATGQLTGEHAQALARVAGSGGADRKDRVAKALADPAASAELLESAKHLDAPRFARAAEAWAARLDPTRLESDHATQRRARFLSLADTPGGTILKGRLDRMAGHRLRLALEAVTPVPSSDDDRDPTQRAADALDALAQGALSDPSSKPGGHVPPHVSLIVTEHTLTGLRALDLADRERRGDDADPAEAVDGASETFSPATLEDGTPVPPSETARILCDAAVTRIVLDAESVPVDLGRTKRLWTGAQRRLVIARDRHCAFPGCQIPARWCEIHHIAWWGRDLGPTDIDNAVLLCTAHHGVVHAQDLTLRRSTAPPGPPGAGLPLASYEITPRARRRKHPPQASRARGVPQEDPRPGVEDNESNESNESPSLRTGPPRTVASVNPVSAPRKGLRPPDPSLRRTPASSRSPGRGAGSPGAARAPGEALF